MQLKEAGLLVYHDRFGPARIVEREGDQYVIELFVSAWFRRKIPAPRTALTRLPLQEQTRVYLQRRQQWRTARVLVGDRTEDGSYEYQVQLPNRVRETYNERDLSVRCWLPHDDPTSTLACGGMETQFFHERRVRFGKTLIEQRAACRGLAGLLSARVDLVPHQIEVARRVLEDPLQRYLLADEVGMGKTIEAGFIIRQFLLTEDTGQVAVVVPVPLVAQWRRELSQKFMVDQFGKRVNLYASADTRLGAGEAPAMLVVDEAHHLVGDVIPQWLTSWSQGAERLLLLSATPSLRDPQVLLSLLQLLDPSSYNGVSAEAFEARLARQSDFGVFVRGLRADANPAVVRQRLRRVGELFPGDEIAHQCANAIGHALENQDSRALTLETARLRSHVADIYRIHHRLLRSRRRDCPSWVFRPRGRSPEANGDVDGSHLRCSWIEDSRLERSFELLEEWRVEMAATVPEADPGRSAVRALYVDLFEALGSGVNRFGQALRNVPLRWMPATLKSEIIQVLEGSTEYDIPRGEALAAELKRHIVALQKARPGRRPKLAVFGSDDADLDACARALVKVFDFRVVLDARALGSSENVAEAFRDNPDAFVLLCGREQEEGLNLHFVDALVHLDLPLSPQRIEQRIGRLDRFGRTHESVEQRIVFPAVDETRSPWEAWYDLLTQGFQLFNVSIADVQFGLEDTVALAQEALFDQGAEGLRALIPDVRSRLNSERAVLDDQYALDRVLQGEDEAQHFFEQLEKIEQAEADISAATHDWIAHALQFDAHRNDAHTVTYRWEASRTQLPALPWKRVFDTGLGHPVTGSRRRACQATAGVQPQLLRIGSPLLRAAERHFAWEDRGVAFATWRVVGDDVFEAFLAFQLSYIIEARSPDGLTGAEAASWRARLDGLFPPFQEALYVDAELRPIEDTRLMALLQRGYVGQAHHGTDFNLGSRLEALHSVIDAVQFEALCRDVRTHSEAMLRESESFRGRVQEALERGDAKMTQRLRRLRQRLTQSVTAIERALLSREIEHHERARVLLSDPAIRLDAVGAIVLSPEPPPADPAH